MKKLLQYIIIGALGLPLLTSCKKGDPTPTALASVGKNTSPSSVDNNSFTKTINVSGLSGKIHEIKADFVGSADYTQDLQLYLQSPSGKVIQLCANESYAYNSAINVSFTDAAASNVANWQAATGSSSYFKGIFKPRGSLVAGFEGNTGTTTTLGGFTGNSPNGTWTLTVCDDETLGSTKITSWELFISTVN